MSPLDYMMVPLKKYADFSGRARRMEFWMFVVFNFAVSLVATIVDAIIGTSTAIGGVAGMVSMVAGLALLIPYIAVAARRLHDQDKSGWWLLLIFLPIIGFFVLLVFFFLGGTKGDNRFGADPKAATA